MYINAVYYILNSFCFNPSYQSPWEKKVGGFYIKVPWVDTVNSCNYCDICKIIPCNCPIPANIYWLPDAVVDITSKLPSAASGDFWITVDMDSNSSHLGCIKL
jgi:hypothetical protein